ncbi:MAG: hypothetical protein H7323_09150 [Frankiales bacterium]|nr:hypothetical protein [Frankiales bacterium]
MTPAVGVRLALLAAALPLVGGIVAVRPAGAQPAPVGYDSYSVSALAAGVRTSGVVGASGGLATLDTGSASVSARLDSSPSAAVRAAPYEPGTLFRTAAGQVNAAAGSAVLDVPDAEAQFPGSQTSGELTTVPPAQGGPVSSRGGSATAGASAASAGGSATAESLLVQGAFEIGASTSVVSLEADGPKGRTVSSARTTVSRVLVAGVLELRDVVATAAITAVGDAHVPTASLVVGGASVAGQAVELSEQGVTAAGTPLVPGQSIKDATAAANAALVAAGVQVRTLGGVRAADGRSATADTGGVAITATTATAPGGVGGDELALVVGGVVLTAVDAPLVPAVVLLPLPSTPVTLPPVSTSPESVSAFVPGSPGTPAVPGTVTPAEPAAPVLGAPPNTVPASLVVAGRRLPAAVVLAAFGVWQFLSLGTATLYAVVDRRRRASLGLLA